MTPHAISIRSHLRLKHFSSAGFLYWRQSPEEIGCNLAFIKEITHSFSVPQRLVVSFEQNRHTSSTSHSHGVHTDKPLELILEFETPELAAQVLKELSDIHKKALVHREEQTPSDSLVKALDLADFHVALKLEQTHQLDHALRTQGCMLAVDKYIHQKAAELKKRVFAQWSRLVGDMNDASMRNDRARWRLHAAASQDMDLQAWYHSCFHKEVYRLRGPFWFRDAVLPHYRKKYDLVVRAIYCIWHGWAVHASGRRFIPT